MFQGMYNNEVVKLKDKMRTFKVMTKKRIIQIKKK